MEFTFLAEAETVVQDHLGFLHQFFLKLLIRQAIGGEIQPNQIGSLGFHDLDLAMFCQEIHCIVDVFFQNFLQLVQPVPAMTKSGFSSNQAYRWNFMLVVGQLLLGEGFSQDWIFDDGKAIFCPCNIEGFGG